VKTTIRLIAILASGMAPTSAHAQLGEFHLGVIAGYGTPDAYRAGAGVSIAIVPGRLAFLGLRYVYHWGTTVPLPTDPGYNVRNTSATLAADLGVQLPVGPAELVIGGSLGTVKFQQESIYLAAPGNPPTEMVAWEFLAAPSVAVYFRVGPILIAPEFQWGLAGDPGFDKRDPQGQHVSIRGPLFYMRFVLPFEIDRIRQ